MFIYYLFLYFYYIYLFYIYYYLRNVYFIAQQAIPGMQQTADEDLDAPS